MRTLRSSRRLALAAVSLAAVATLSACGGSSEDGAASGAGDTAEVTEETVVEGGSGAMADAGFAVTTYMDTIWPIEGNPYADAPAAEGWCTTYATDPDAAVAAVVEYLSAEPDIAAADPASVTTAIDEYLTNNCYLLEE